MYGETCCSLSADRSPVCVLTSQLVAGVHSISYPLVPDNTMTKASSVVLSLTYVLDRIFFNLQPTYMHDADHTWRLRLVNKRLLRHGTDFAYGVMNVRQSMAPMIIWRHLITISRKDRSWKHINLLTLQTSCPSKLIQRVFDLAFQMSKTHSLDIEASRTLIEIRPSPLSEMRTLTVNRSVPVGHNAHDHVSMLDMLLSTMRIQRLCLIGLNLHEVQQICAAGCAALVDIEIRVCYLHRCTPTQWSDIFRLLPRLESFSMSDGATPTLLQAELPQSLRTLRLGGCLCAGIAFMQTLCTSDAFDIAECRFVLENHDGSLHRCKTWHEFELLPIAHVRQLADILRAELDRDHSQAVVSQNSRINNGMPSIRACVAHLVDSYARALDKH